MWWNEVIENPVVCAITLRVSWKTRKLKFLISVSVKMYFIVKQIGLLFGLNACFLYYPMHPSPRLLHVCGVGRRTRGC